MASVPLRLVFLIILIGIVQCRILKLNSEEGINDDLISDGVYNHFVTHTNSTTLFADDTPSMPSACDHQYGFLPCAENAAGYIFQIMVYQGLLIVGEKQIGKGSKLLFSIIGAGKFGGIIFRILMSLPSMMLMIVSGVFSDKAAAQSQVSIGVGIYAGITVFSLTLQWGMCLIFGRRDLKQTSTNYEPIPTSDSNCLQAKEKLAVLKDTGVATDAETQHTAGIMLLSLIPYVLVQLDDIFSKQSGSRLVTMIILIVSSFCLISYFIYQILNPWITQRSLDYTKYEMLRTGFLTHMQRHGQLMNEDGKLNAAVIKKLFDDTDKDADKCLTKDEMEKLVLEIIQTGKVKVDESFAVSEVMKTFDFNDDLGITEDEFIHGCKKWIDETNQSSENNASSSQNIFHEVSKLVKEKKVTDPHEMDKIMSKILKHCEAQLLISESLITPDGKPDVESIRSLFKKFDSDGDKSISTSELENLISTVKFGDFHPKYENVVKELFKDFDKDKNKFIDEPEFIEGVTKWLNRAVRVANNPDKAKSIDTFDEIVWKQQIVNKWALTKSILQIILGISMLTLLGGPLMVSILQLSFSMNLPSFSISFVVVPFAMNARSAITALLPASHKSERTASLTFSEIYGGVIMNNIAGMTTLLAIIYAKNLTFDFSAEVLTVLVVCAVVGILAYSRTTYPLWTSIIAFLLYPFSLGLFSFMQFSSSLN